ncbi:MAG: hypothetical protein FJY19_02785 [Bacteroidetes bacterium]|nr:hypothetical protein [Bacteroidota bacterium]
MFRLLFVTAIFAYGFSSMGWVLDVHYCKGKVEEIHFFEHKMSSCNSNEMPAEDCGDCCYEEAAFVMLIQDQRPPVTLNFTLQSPVFSLPPTSILTGKLCSCSSQHVADFSHSPPGKHIPIFLQNKVFRI